ncbi:c-type cytochrome [Nitrogeniibacter mangrovi]|uniref:c-type cytochrome n=1 Tax=Nitrogeniibacter mangrovi TaxID=2016596 RepID=UPI001E60ED3C|nr:c-type cytochrome [Nitrogeniibacter mangrovi]
MSRTLARLACLVALCFGVALGTRPAHANNVVAIPPHVDTTGLPPLDDPNAEPNPYRGNPQAIGIGREAFNQSCARCHGVDADAHRSPAPDLRRVGRACERVREPALKTRCETDADVYFRHSVEEGKVKVGVRHMPAWKSVLSPQLIWAIRSFVDQQGSVQLNAPPHEP